MKRSSKVLYVVLMALPLVVTLIVLGFLPGQVPVHYGPDFQVDRWGSKYELLLLPGFTVLMGLLLLFFGRLAARQEGTGQNNAKAAVTAGLLCMALFNALTYYFLYTAWAQVTDLSALPVGVEQVAFGCMGALLLVAGNLNPKLRNNSLMGLRTPWSRKNDRGCAVCFGRAEREPDSGGRRDRSGKRCGDGRRSRGGKSDEPGPGGHGVRRRRL